MAERYRVEVLRSAARDLGDLPRKAVEKLAQKIDALATDPRPRGSKVLKGGDGQLRVRVGDFRILYRVDDAARLVLVVKVGHRREVYR
jgi:mRNA interferase RelE/StbE